MHDIFVSYARDDKPSVRKLVESFENEGWSVWWDDRIEIGVKYSRILDEALNQSRCVVVCWTGSALQSEYVKSEAHRGDARHLLVQIALEKVVLPNPFSEYAISDLSDWSEEGLGNLEYQKLIRDIGGRLTLASTEIPIDTSNYVPGFLGRPATAVLPFRNLSDKEDLDYVLDGLSEEIIDRLQRFKSLPIISGHSTLRLQDFGEVGSIAKQLGARYLVLGTLREVGGDYRLRIELVEAPGLRSVWSTSCSLNDFDRLTLQDDLSLSIAAQLQPEIERSARQAALPIRQEDADTWHLIRQGIWHQYQLTRDNSIIARNLFLQAVERDQYSTEALVQLAWWHFWDISFRRGNPGEWHETERYAQQAANIDPSDSRPITLIGISHMMRSNHEEARKYYQKAIDLNPSYAWAYAHMGSSLYLDGQPESSLVFTTKAIRLSPLDFFVFHAYCDIATSNYTLRNYSSALDAANYSLGLRQGYWLAHVIKIATLVEMGREKDAESALTEMLATKPNISRRDIDWVMFTDRRWNDSLADGLKKAGWQEGKINSID